MLQEAKQLGGKNQYFVDTFMQIFPFILFFNDFLT